MMCSTAQVTSKKLRKAEKAAVEAGVPLTERAIMSKAKTRALYDTRPKDRKLNKVVKLKKQADEERAAGPAKTNKADFDSSDVACLEDLADVLGDLSSDSNDTDGEVSSQDGEETEALGVESGREMSSRSTKPPGAAWGARLRRRRCSFPGKEESDTEEDSPAP